MEIINNAMSESIDIENVESFTDYILLLESEAKNNLAEKDLDVTLVTTPFPYSEWLIRDPIPNNFIYNVFILLVISFTILLNFNIIFIKILRLQPHSIPSVIIKDTNTVKSLNLSQLQVSYFRKQRTFSRL